MTLAEARNHVGAGVVYTPYPDGPREDGTITAVNDRYVFVHYVGDRAAKATPPDRLDLLAGTP